MPFDVHTCTLILFDTSNFNFSRRHVVLRKYRSIGCFTSTAQMVGMKRPCPFSTLQDPSKKLLHCKFNPFSIQSNSGPFRSVSADTFNPKRKDSTVSFGLYINMLATLLLLSRDGMPHSNSSSDLLYTKYNRAEYMTTSDGDFLKLASPVTMSLFPNSKSEQAQSYYLHNHQAELLKHKSTSPSVTSYSFTDSIKRFKCHGLCFIHNDLESLDSLMPCFMIIVQVVYPLGLGSQEQEQQQSFFAFLPEQNITQDGRSSVTTSHPTDDQDQECLDLSLKL